MITSERARLRFDCFEALKGWGTTSQDGDGKSKFNSWSLEDRKKYADDLFKWCLEVLPQAEPNADTPRPDK